MALWRCKRCGSRFAVGLHRCPQCTGIDVEEFSEEAEAVAKISVSGGPTVAVRGQAPAAKAEVVAGGEPLSAGNSSPRSSERSETNSEANAHGSQQPARTTASRSSRGRRESSTARTTGGSGRAAGGE